MVLPPGSLPGLPGANIQGQRGLVAGPSPPPFYHSEAGPGLPAGGPGQPRRPEIGRAHV